MSFFGLTMAGSALAAYQEAENVASNNITNVNTPGASRQQAVLTEAPPITGTIGYPMHTFGGTQGDGVLLQLIQRVHADSYDTLYRNATSSQYFYQVQQQQLSAAQALLSEPSGGINDAYTAFTQSIQQLQANPSDPATEHGVISAASGLVNAISTTGNGIQAQEAQVINQATSLVSQFNGILDQIAQLNGQIRASMAAGDNPNTYKDQRDQLIDQLSQYMSVQTNLQANGSALVTVNGMALVNDTVAYHIAAPVVGTNANGTVALKIGFANDPNPTNPTQIPLGQGQFAGLLDLYNNKLSVYATQLDSFTNALATEVDRVTTSGFDANGVPGAALLQPIVSSKAISATNVRVGITDASQVVSVLASTAAGTLTNPVNASNQTVDTSTSIINNNTLQYSATGPLAGTLTVNVDSVNQTFTYSTTPGAAQIDASSIDNFIRTFNALQSGVTASYDTTGQKLVFTRDPNNESLDLRSNINYVAGPTFSIHDSNNPGAAGGAGPETSLLGVLGAAGLDGIANSVTTASTLAGTNTITVANATGFAAGQTIDIDSGANLEVETITAVNGNTLTLGAALANNHASNTQVYQVAGNVAVVQNATNAYGRQDNSAAIALSKMFQSPVGVPGIATQAGTFIPPAPFTAPVGQSTITMTESPAVALQQFGEINPGQQLTLVGYNGATGIFSQLNAVVSAVNRVAGTITLQVTNNGAAPVTFNLVPPNGTGAAGTYTALMATPTQTLGQFYGSLIAQVGLDGQTATTGTQTQTNIANSINQTRQGIDGINLDEETQNLLMYQTAYQAAAKTVTVMDTMLQSILNMVQ
jgi:flagellar hook-associated protein 1 FlgK